MNEKLTAFKAILTTFCTMLTLYFGVLSVPIIILIILMVCDYITGMANAYINHTLSSRTGIKGIIKKLCYFFAVIASMGIDWVISLLGIYVENNCMIAMIVTIWLIINEIISILENLKKVGVPVPKFLYGVIERLKISADEHIKKS